MQSNLSDEIEYAKYLYSVGYIPGPQTCSCGSKAFNIYKDSYSKTSFCSFRCINTKCRKKYPVRIN